MTTAETNECAASPGLVADVLRKWEEENCDCDVDHVCLLHDIAHPDPTRHPADQTRIAVLWQRLRAALAAHGGAK